jgi:hypothetical protein
MNRRFLENRRFRAEDFLPGLSYAVEGIAG